MRISHGLTPPGGWIYHEGDIIVYGTSWDELLKNVKDHRAANCKVAGDAEEDIENQIAEKFPRLVINGDYSVKKR